MIKFRALPLSLCYLPRLSAGRPANQPQPSTLSIEFNHGRPVPVSPFPPALLLWQALATGIELELSQPLHSL